MPDKTHFDVGVVQVYLGYHRHELEPRRLGRLRRRERLCLHALGGVHQQQRPLAGREAPHHLRSAGGEQVTIDEGYTYSTYVRSVFVEKSNSTTSNHRDLSSCSIAAVYVCTVEGYLVAEINVPWRVDEVQEVAVVDHARRLSLDRDTSVPLNLTAENEVDENGVKTVHIYIYIYILRAKLGKFNIIVPEYRNARGFFDGRKRKRKCLSLGCRL